MKTYTISQSSANHSQLIAILFLLLGLASSNNRLVEAQGGGNAGDLAQPQNQNLLRRRTLSAAPNRKLQSCGLDVDITCSVPSLGPTMTSCDNIPIPNDGCRGNRPSSLTLMFVGGDCGESQNTQSIDDFSCYDLGVSIEETLYIRAQDIDGSTILFEGSVAIGDSFTISNFMPDINVQVFDSDPRNGGLRLQDMTFKVLCTSGNLKLNDRFGSVQVAAMTESDGKVIDSNVDITFTANVAVAKTDSNSVDRLVSLETEVTASDTLGSVTNAATFDSLGSGSFGTYTAFGSGQTENLGTYTIDLSKRSKYSLQGEG